jgi:hypothetical protein
MEAIKKIYFGRNFVSFKYFTYHLQLVPKLAPNSDKHILSPAKVRKVCYSSDELYVKICLFEFIRKEGQEVHETF